MPFVISSASSSSKDPDTLDIPLIIIDWGLFLESFKSNQQTSVNPPPDLRSGNTEMKSSLNEITQIIDRNFQFLKNSEQINQMALDFIKDHQEISKGNFDVINCPKKTRKHFLNFTLAYKK